MPSGRLNQAEDCSRNSCDTTAARDSQASTCRKLTARRCIIRSKRARLFSIRSSGNSRRASLRCAVEGRLKAILRELARRSDRRPRCSGPQARIQHSCSAMDRSRWRATVEDSFRDSLLEREGWLRSDAILEQLEKAAQQGCAPNQFWYSFVLESWLKHERAQSEPFSSRKEALKKEAVHRRGAEDAEIAQRLSEYKNLCAPSASSAPLR